MKDVVKERNSDLFEIFQLNLFQLKTPEKKKRKIIEMFFFRSEATL